MLNRFEIGRLRMRGIAVLCLPPPIRRKVAEIMPLVREAVQRAVTAGVEITSGTGTPVFPHGVNAKEVGALVGKGMALAEAVCAATVKAAEFLTVGDRGRLVEVLLADSIAVSVDSLRNITVLGDLRFVMKGGHVYKRPAEVSE